MDDCLDNKGLDGGSRKCLEWEHHHTNMVDAFVSVLATGNLTDVTLESAEGHRIKAHQIILSAGSLYFQKVLKGNQCNNTIIILKDIKYADLQAIVQFIYTGKLDVDANRIPVIKLSAASLQVKGLTDCETLVRESKLISSGEKATKTISSDKRLTPPIPSLSSSANAQINACDDEEVIHNVQARESTKVAVSTGEDLVQENSHFPHATTTCDMDSCAEEKDMSAGKQIRNVTGHQVPSTPLLPSGQKKRETWLDPDALSRRRSSINQSRTKQITGTRLIPRCSFKLNQSNHKSFRAGGTADSPTEGSRDVYTKKDKSETKRRSKESVENVNELETISVDLQIPQHIEISSHEKSFPPANEVQSTRATLLSHERRTNNTGKTTDDIRKKIKGDILWNDPLDILKHYDKIPDFKTPSTKKCSNNEGKAKQHRRESECTCCGQPEELRKICPVHGSEVNDQLPLPIVGTPDHFWCTKQYTTQELYDEGRIIVGTPFTPPPRRKRRRNNNETFDDTENVDVRDE